MTFAGAGLALFGASPANLSWFTGHMGKRTIGEDKLNQLRHVRFLRDGAGIEALMDAHRRLLAPKFAAVREGLAELLGGTGAARWTDPKGGYFISLDVRPGSARRTVALAAAAGITLVPAGQAFPHGRDPDDSNIRLAPSFPPVEEVREITRGVALSALLSVSEALLHERDAA
jgi:DNA-binding transcriptional MocR family regulator